MLHYTKTLENLSQHCNITLLRGDDVISDVIKNAVYIQRRTFNKSFSKEKKHDTASQLLKEYANRNRSRR